MDTIPYNLIRSELKTGDLILFSGRSRISYVIRAGSMSKWSHVGLVLRVEPYDFVTLWETPGVRLKDLDTGEYHKGVMLVPLSIRLATYDGEFGLRRLEGGVLSQNSLNELMALRKRLQKVPYEKNKWEVFRAAYDGIFGDNEEDLSSLFCSELVAEAYQSLGLLPQDLPSNEYTPADFSQNRMKKLLGGFSLSDEILLSYP